MKSRLILSSMLVIGLMSMLVLTGCDENAKSSAYKAAKNTRETGQCTWRGLTGKDDKGCK